MGPHNCVFGPVPIPLGFSLTSSHWVLHFPLEFFRKSSLVRSESRRGGVAARVGFCPVITASQVLAGRPARDPWLGRRLIFVGLQGERRRAACTKPSRRILASTPHHSSHSTKLHWRRPLHLSLLAAAASFSKLGDQIRARVKTKTNPIPAHLVPLFEFWGVQPGSQSLGTNSPNYVASSLESWRCFHGAPASEAKAFCRAELQRGNCNVGPLLD